MSPSEPLYQCTKCQLGRRRAASNQPGYGQVRERKEELGKPQPVGREGCFPLPSNAPWELHFLPAGHILMGLHHLLSQPTPIFPLAWALWHCLSYPREIGVLFQASFSPLIYFLSGLAREQSLKLADLTKSCGNLILDDQFTQSCPVVSMEILPVL